MPSNDEHDDYEEDGDDSGAGEYLIGKCVEEKVQKGTGGHTNHYHLSDQSSITHHNTMNGIRGLD